MVGGGGVGEVEVDGWEGDVDERLLTGMEVRKALRAAQLPEGQARVWDMELFVSPRLSRLSWLSYRDVIAVTIC